MNLSMLVRAALTLCVLATGGLTPAAAKDRIVYTIGTGTTDGVNTTLFIANADGSDERRLLAVPAYDYSASFSADGKWVVFTSERSGPAKIYRAHPDGSGLERLTDGVAFDDQAALSPDGRQMALVSTRRNGVADIWLMDMRTHKLRNLTQGAGGSFRPSWSPDGQWIAFTSERGVPIRPRANGFEQVQEARIYIVRPNGKDLRQITPAGMFSGSPKWSADGKQIVYYEMAVADTYTVRRTGGAARVVSQIATVDVATGERHEISSGPGAKQSPQFVNGQIGYVIKAGEHAGLAFSGGGFAAPGAMRSPVWSPDGRHVVYQRLDTQPYAQNQPLYSNDPQRYEFVWSNPFPAFSRSGKLAVIGDFPRTRLMVMDADGGHARQVIDAEPDGTPLYPSWSPDEQWITYAAGPLFAKTRTSQIMLIRADGSEKRQLTQGAGNSGFPSFSRDGKEIVYRYWTAQEQGLRIINLADGSIRTLTTEADNFPSWSPTQDLIEFTRPSGGAYDIFTIRPDGTELKQLTNAPGNDAHARWSADGARLLFPSARLGNRDEVPLYDEVPQPYSELFVMNADGSDQRPLTDNKWEDGTPAWQPVGVKQ